jgi:hypothetical protein
LQSDLGLVLYLDSPPVESVSFPPISFCYVMCKTYDLKRLL